MRATTDKVRVLYVGDRPTDSERAFRERLGESVAVESADPGAVLDRLAGDGFDCVVADHDAQGVDGVGLLRSIRAAHGDLPVVLFAGSGSEAVASEAISAGVTDYVRKGEGVDALADAVESALADSRERTGDRELFEKAGEGFILHDPETGEILDANGTVAEMLGYERAELLSMGVESFSADDPRFTDAEATRLIRRARSSGPQTVEWLTETADGEELWLEVNLTGVTLDGRDRVLATLRDISGRKARERELRRYETVVENARDAAWTYDADGHFSLVNERTCEMLDCTETELVGRHFADVLADVVDPDHDLDEQLRETEAVLSGERDSARTELPLWIDGEPITVELQITHVDVGDVGTSAVGIARNVTERAQLEAELRRETNRFDSLMETIPVGIYFKNADAEHVRVSDHQCRQYGEAQLVTPDGEWLTEPEDFVGKTDRDIYHESIAEETYADDERVIETGESIVGKEERHERPDGPDVWVSTTKVPWYDEVGEIQGLIGTTIDITERKRYRQQLERKNERLEEFASIVSHDLRNPLTVLGGSLELAESTGEPRHFERCEDAVERMEALVEDLLTLAREGKAVEERETVDLADLVAECWTTVETGAAKLAVETEDVVRADRSRLRQLLENLLGNAVEHGGEDVTVTVGTLAGGDGDRAGGFYVADDGTGIPESEREQIFESGYTTSATGTGFGLDIVERVADAHGWSVTVTESSRGGARFEFSGVDVE